MKTISMLMLLASLTACASRGVHCDDRLQAINAPKTKVPPMSSATWTAPPTAAGTVAGGRP